MSWAISASMGCVASPMVDGAVAGLPAVIAPTFVVARGWTSAATQSGGGGFPPASPAHSFPVSNARHTRARRSSASCGDSGGRICPRRAANCTNLRSMRSASIWRSAALLRGSNVSACSPSIAAASSAAHRVPPSTSENMEHVECAETGRRTTEKS